MATISFVKPSLLKVFVLDIKLKQLFDFYNYLNYTDPNLDIVASRTLTDAESTALQTFVNAYQDPVEYLELNYVTSNASKSKGISSSTLSPAITWILSGTSNTDSMGIFNALKTVLCTQTNDMSLFADVQSVSVQFELYSVTRDYVMASITIDISDVVASWKASVLAGTLGASDMNLKSIMLDNLKNCMCDYDNICQIKLSVTNPNICVSTNGMQLLYYRSM
jgi:hypothetical protein